MSKDRAVAVCLDQGRVLVMRRHKDGRDYTVLPGGGVEEGEDPSAAVLRELEEETGLHGRGAPRHLATLDHPDRRAHYFLVDVVPAPMKVAGPEAATQSAENSYTPCWLPLSQLDREPLMPQRLRRDVPAWASAVGS